MASFTEESVTKLLFILAVAVECCITVTKDKGSYIPVKFVHGLILIGPVWNRVKSCMGQT